MADRDGGGSRGRMNLAGSTATHNPERTIPALGDTLPCPSPVEVLLQAIWDDPGCVPCSPCRQKISRLAEIAAGVVRSDGALTTRPEEKPWKLKETMKEAGDP